MQKNGAAGELAYICIYNTIYIIVLYIFSEKISHRLADGDRDGTHNGAHPCRCCYEGTRRRRRRQGQASETSSQTGCRGAVRAPGLPQGRRGVTLRRRACPDDAASVLSAVPTTTTCVTGRRVRTPYALLAFLPFIAPNGAERQKQHIYASFYDGKMVKSRFRKMVKISILQKRIFCVHIWAYF